MNRTLGVLISGRGSNLQAIIDAIEEGRLDARIGVVISNRACAPGLERARRAGIPAVVIEHRAFPTREQFDAAVVAELAAHDVGLVCLAGFMRLLSRVMIDAFPMRILNIHPALLPAFKGVDAQRQAWEHGVKITGVTVHFVTPDLDDGPIVMQAPVHVDDGDTPESLAARILEVEHRIYPEAIAYVLEGNWKIVGRRVVRTSEV